MSSQHNKIQSLYTDVMGSKMHYLKCGSGKNVLFIHGMPTSSYLWRKIIPKLSSHSCCYAPDLIGMGKSDKPEISYTVDDHISYISEFIRELNLTDITLVVHAWGSVIGLEYARRNPQNIASLVFFEAHFARSITEDSLSLPVQEFTSMIRSSSDVYEKVVENNFLVNNFLRAGVIGTLSDDDHAEYKEPFKSEKDRKVLLQYVLELPFGKKPNRVSEIISGYTEFILNSNMPKLFLYSIPGFTTTVDTINWAKLNIPNITVEDIGHGLHFSQETNHDEFVHKLSSWYKSKLLS